MERLTLVNFKGGAIGVQLLVQIILTAGLKLYTDFGEGVKNQELGFMGFSRRVWIWIVLLLLMMRKKKKLVDGPPSHNPTTQFIYTA